MFKIKATDCLVWGVFSSITGESDRSINCSNRIGLPVVGCFCLRSYMQANPFIEQLTRNVTRMAAYALRVSSVVLFTALSTAFVVGCKTGDGYYDTPRSANPAYGSAGAASGGGFGASKQKQKPLQERVDAVHAAIDRQFDEP